MMGLLKKKKEKEKIEVPEAPVESSVEDVVVGGSGGKEKKGEDVKEAVEALPLEVRESLKDLEKRFSRVYQLPVSNSLAVGVEQSMLLLAVFTELRECNGLLRELIGKVE